MSNEMAKQSIKVMLRKTISYSGFWYFHWYCHHVLSCLSFIILHSCATVFHPRSTIFVPLIKLPIVGPSILQYPDNKLNTKIHTVLCSFNLSCSLCLSHCILLFVRIRKYHRIQSKVVYKKTNLQVVSMSIPFWWTNK